MNDRNLNPVRCYCDTDFNLLEVDIDEGATMQQFIDALMPGKHMTFKKRQTIKFKH